jgi:DNA-binding phage protein
VKKSKKGHISEPEVPRVGSANLEEFDEYESSLDFSNPEHIREILMQHFIEGEHETFLELLALYIDHVGKTKISQKTQIPERTIYNFIRGDHKTSSENVFRVMKFISDEVKKKSA